MGTTEVRVLVDKKGSTYTILFLSVELVFSCLSLHPWFVSMCRLWNFRCFENSIYNGSCVQERFSREFWAVWPGNVWNGFSRFHWVQVSFSGYVGMNQFYAFINLYLSNSKSHWFRNLGHYLKMIVDWHVGPPCQSYIFWRESNFL